MEQLLDHCQNKSHIIWDFNGTLVDDVRPALNAVNKALSHFGKPEISIEYYRKNFRFPVSQFYEDLGFDWKTTDQQQVSDLFHHHFHIGWPDVQIRPGVSGVLLELNSQDKIQSVLSAAQQSDLEVHLQNLGIRRHFHHIFGLNDRLAHSKIERGRQLLDQAGIEAEQCLLVGDTDHDWEVARALGIDVVLLDGGHQCPTRLEGLEILAFVRNKN